jgi:uncharacterized repeat protein (TIGR01451 family)
MISLNTHSLLRRPRRYFPSGGLAALLAVGLITAGGLVGCDDDEVASNDTAAGISAAAVGQDAVLGETEEAGEIASFTDQEGKAGGIVEGEASTDAITLNKALPEKIALGTPMTYQINVSAAEDLNGVMIKEQFPEGFEYESSTPEGSLSEDGRTLTLRLGSLSADQQQEIQITGTPQQAGQLESCTTFDFERGVCTQFAVVNPNLTLTKSGPETANVCEPIVYTYTLKNSGETEATEVVLYDMLPEGLSVVEGDREVRVEVGALAPGQEVQKQVEVVAEKPGTIASYAYAESNFDEVRSKKVQTQVVGPELNVAVQPERGWDYIGKTARFNVTVTNTGQAPSHNTVVGTEFEGVGEIVGVNGQIGNQEAAEEEVLAQLTDDGIVLGTIPAGESRNFSVEVMAEDAGRMVLMAEAATVCPGTEAVLASAEAASAIQIRALSALQISVIDKQDPVKVGEQTVYELTIINEGSASDSNVKATGQLPEGVIFVGAQGPTEVTADGQNLTFAPIPELPPGESATWYVTVEAAEAAGSTKLTINATSDAVEQAITAEEPTRLY